MSEEPKKDAKTTADGAAGVAPDAAEAKTPARGGDVAQESDKAAGKDEGKKKDKDEKKDKDKDEKKGKDEKKVKDPGDGKTPAPPFKIPESAILAAAIVVSLAAGSLLGSLLIAPQVIAARNARPAAPAPAGEAEGAGGAQDGEGQKGKGEKGKGEKPAVYRIDNIVVNPAGSVGTRFLMASVAFELPDEKAAAALREQEVQIRDAVITTLESQTLEMLTAPGSRANLKRQLAIVIKPLVPGHQQLHVYLPQFVIQ